MADAVQIIKEKINLAINQKLSQNVMNKIKKELGNLLDKFMRDRLNMGIDAKGGKIKALSPRYNKWKKRYIAGSLKHRQKTLRSKPQWYNELYDTTQYKAVKVPNYGRLTGKTISGLNPEIKGVRLVGNRIEFIAELQTLASGRTRKPDKTQKIISGLRAKGRDYYAMLAPASTNIGRKERQMIMDAIKRVAKI